MPGFARGLSTGVVLLICSLILLIIVSISLPTFSALDFVRFKADQPINDGDSQARFGIWAACTYRESSSTRICTPTGHGYSVLLVNLISGDIKTLTPSWTRGLAIHPVAAIVTFIATVLSIFPLTSFSLAGTILTFVAAFLALLAFICDIALLAHIKQLLKDAQGYDVSSGPGFWLTFISVVFLLAASYLRFAEDRRESRRLLA